MRRREEEKKWRSGEGTKWRREEVVKLTYNSQNAQLLFHSKVAVITMWKGYKRNLHGWDVSYIFELAVMHLASNLIKMKLLFLIISICIYQQLNAQIQVKNLDQSTIPKKIQIVGKMYKAVSWTDNFGNNIAILSNTGKSRSKNPPEDGYNDAALYAYHYIISGDSFKFNWRVYDFVNDCPLDLILNFIPNTFAVTDLDNNGLAEVWIMYKSACTGDVSPNSLKIIMYENKKKFALRGNSQVKVSDNEIIGGHYAIDEAFKNGHPSFRKYAENLWNNHKVETWE